MSDQTARIGVLLAGGTAATRRGVRTLLAHDARFAVLDEARTRLDLLELTVRHRPQAVVLDPELPGGATAALVELMASHPLPVVVYGAARHTTAEAQAELRAAGAIDVVRRPVLEGVRPSSTLSAREPGAELIASLALAARIRVIRHPRGRLLPARSAPPLPRHRTAAPVRPEASETAVALVVIGASTGGPTALGELLAGLPVGLAAATLVIQHMPAGFLPGLAGWLDDRCPLPVRLAADGDLLRPGEVLVCPGGVDTVVEPVHDPVAAGRVRCLPPRPPGHHVPSIDRAFDAVAAGFGDRSVGVLLTGMGRDGASGLRALRDAGAATVAQDEATCAIFGMPRAAEAAGAVERMLPLGEIATAVQGLVTLVQRRATSR